MELLREDMRRCLRSLEKESHLWGVHAVSSEGRTPAHTSGMRAYAFRHEDQWLSLSARFRKDWDKPHGRTKRLILEQAASLLDDRAATYVGESAALLGLNNDEPPPVDDAS